MVAAKNSTNRRQASGPAALTQLGTRVSHQSAIRSVAHAGRAGGSPTVIVVGDRVMSEGSITSFMDPQDRSRNGRPGGLVVGPSTGAERHAVPLGYWPWCRHAADANGVLEGRRGAPADRAYNLDGARLAEVFSHLTDQPVRTGGRMGRRVPTEGIAIDRRSVSSSFLRASPDRLVARGRPAGGSVEASRGSRYPGPRQPGNFGSAGPLPISRLGSPMLKPVQSRRRILIENPSSRPYGQSGGPHPDTCTLARRVGP